MSDGPLPDTVTVWRCATCKAVFMQQRGIIKCTACDGDPSHISTYVKRAELQRANEAIADLRAHIDLIETVNAIERGEQ